MKKILCLAALFTLFALPVMAAEGDGWETNFEQAKKLAAEKKRPILALFTGSDWCGWCIKLNKEVLSKPDFKKFADKELVLLYLDFPSKKPISDDLKKQNRELGNKYNVKGYPTTVLLNADGTEIARIGGFNKEYVKAIKAKLPKK